MNGDRQYLAINHTNGGSVYINLPSEWSSVGSSAVDDYLGRLQLFDRIITGDDSESNAWNASGDSFSQRVGIGPPTGQTCSFQIEANFPDVAPSGRFLT